MPTAVPSLRLSGLAQEWLRSSIGGLFTSSAAAEESRGGESGADTRRLAEQLADAVARRGATAAEDPFDPATYLGEGRSFESLLGGLTAD